MKNINFQWVPRISLKPKQDKHTKTTRSNIAVKLPKNKKQEKILEAAG